MSRGQSRPPALALARTPRTVSPALDSPGPCPCHGPSLDLIDLCERAEGRAGRGPRAGARAGGQGTLVKAGVAHASAVY